MSDTEQTTPVWGYNAAGESRIFQLKGDEVLPEGWHESPSRAVVEGVDQSAERELRLRLEQRAAAVGLAIDPPWTNTRLEAELHRAEAVKAAEKTKAPQRAEAPQETKSEARKAAEAASRIPPVGESGAERGLRSRRIDEQQNKAARLLKQEDARKQAADDEAGKPKADGSDA